MAKMAAVEPHRPRDRIRLLAAGYLIVQGAATAAWWVALLADPSTRTLFFPAQYPHVGVVALLPSDIALMAIASFVAAYGIGRGTRWAFAALCVQAGASAYAGLFTWGLAIASGEAWIGAAVMTPPTIVPLYFVWRFMPR
ncbi:MAG: hypothetical protein IH851_06245 [Armatimonadetes bacterium]|nr:hypothetical protein [Armatimonadota bacterium]